MNKLEALFNPSPLEQDKYDDLVEYFEDRFNTEGIDVLVEMEDKKSTRFDFNASTSVWLNGAVIEGSLRKGTKKIMNRIIENTPIEITNYVRYE